MSKMKKLDIIFITLIFFIILFFSSFVSSSELVKRWSFKVGGKIKDVMIDDIDDDDIDDIIFFFKNNNPYRSDYLYVLDIDGNVKWYKGEDDINAIYISDFGYGNLKKRIAISYGKSSEGIERGRILFLNSRGREIMKYPNPLFGFIPVFNKMIATDINNNGYYELIGSTSMGVYAINDVFNDEMWESITWSAIKDFVITDIDKNGQREIIAKSSSTIYNINIDDGKLNWKSDIKDNLIELNASENKTIDLLLKGGRNIDVMRIGNVDPSPLNEIIAVTPVGIFFVYNCSGNLTGIGGNIDVIKTLVINYTKFEYYNQTDVANITALNLFDFNKDGLDELIVGDNSGFYIINHISNERRFYPVGNVNDIKVIDNHDIIIFTGNAIYKLNENKEIEEHYYINKKYQNLYVYNKIGNYGFILVDEEGISLFEIPNVHITTTSTSTSSTTTTSTSTSTSTSTTTSTTLTPTTSTTSTTYSVSNYTTITSSTSTTISSTTTTISNEPTEGIDINIVDLFLIISIILMLMIIVKFGIDILKERTKR